MSERFFRVIVGVFLLAILYFELHGAIPALIAILLIEGISNYRVPMLVTQLRQAQVISFGDSSELMPDARAARFGFEAERAWRIAVALTLAVTVYAFNEQLWFFPWFMGFAIFGAGLSGVCPVLISLKLLGFR